MPPGNQQGAYDFGPVNAAYQQRFGSAPSNILDMNGESMYYDSQGEDYQNALNFKTFNSPLMRDGVAWHPLSENNSFSNSSAVWDRMNTDFPDYIQGQRYDENGITYAPKNAVEAATKSVNQPSFIENLMDHAPQILGSALVGYGAFGPSGFMGDASSFLSNATSGVPSGGASSIGVPVDAGYSTAMGGMESFGALPQTTTQLAGGAVGGAAEGMSLTDWLKRLISPPRMGGANDNSMTGLLQSLASLGGGIYGLNQANKMGNLAAPGNAAAERLTALTNNPGDVTKMPGYQELLKQREVALSRRLAAQGYNLSGNERASLAELGGAQYAEFYNNEMNRLTQQVSGAVTPTAQASNTRADAVNRLIYGGLGLAGRMF